MLMLPWGDPGRSLEILCGLMLILNTANCVEYNFSTEEPLSLSQPPSNGTAQKKILYVMGFIAWTGPWPTGPETTRTYELALKHINDHPNVLPGYELKVIWIDTKNDQGIAANSLIKQLYKPPTKIGILGPALDKSCVSTAEFAHFYNLLQVGPDVVSPELSDKGRFPLYFRMWPSELRRNPPLIELLKIYNWKKVAIIYGYHNVFTETTDHLMSLLTENNITVLTTETFLFDPRNAVKVLQERDARIIIVINYEEKARPLLCEAYRKGLYGPHIVWHLNGWFNPKWWRLPDWTGRNPFDCTPDEMEEVTEGVIYTSAVYEPQDRNLVGVSGFTPKQIDDILYAEKEFNTYISHFERFYYYDTVWSFALALNESTKRLAKLGKDLSDFSYDDDVMGDVIEKSMESVVFQGPLGLRWVDESRDPKVNFNITYQKNGTYVEVGVYIYNREGGGQIVWRSPARIEWPDGKVPSDSTRIVELPLYMDFNIFISLISISGLGIVFAVIFLCFNVVFRKKRLIKMSSPKMNNLILLGCISIFTTVLFYEQDEELTEAFCTVRVFTLTLGFSLVFGSLFSKTWRVHVIFASKKAKSVNIQDRQLFFIVLVIVCLNTVILVIWVIIDPSQRLFITDTQKVVDSDEDIAIRYRVSVCVSAYRSTFMNVLYVIQGVILAFGAFLAWETRKVKVEALNDSQLIGTCIYNVFILSALGVALGYILSDEIHLVSALNATFMILGTFCTQCVIFMPKVVAVIRDQADVAPSTMKKESNNSQPASQPSTTTSTA